MRLVGDRERERTAEDLRGHYLDGRISEDELADRLHAALHARTRLDLLVAARHLPGYTPLHLLFGAPARAASTAIARAALLVVLAGVWLAGSFVLFVVFGATVLVHGASTGTLVGFPLVWVLMNWALWRVWLSRRPG